MRKIIIALVLFMLVAQDAVLAKAVISPPAATAKSSVVKTSVKTSQPVSYVLQQLAMNLASPVDSVTATSTLLFGRSKVSIIEGGTIVQIKLGQLITPSQAVAIRQIIDTLAQPLVINSKGVTTGGCFTFSTLDATTFSDVVIPTGVTAKSTTTTSPVVITNGLLADGTVLGVGGLNIQSDTIAVAPTGAILTQVSGTITSPSITLATTGDITNAGNIHALGSLNLSSQGNLINTGTIASGNATGLNVSNIMMNSGVVTSGGGVTANTGSFLNSGHMAATGAVAVTSQMISNSGSIVGGSTVSLSSTTGVTNAGVLQATGALSLTATSGNFNNQGMITAYGTSTITAGTFSNSGSISITGGQLNLDTDSVTNAGWISATGLNGNVSVQGPGNGLIISNTGSMSAAGALSFADSACVNLSGNGSLTAQTNVSFNSLNGSVSVTANSLSGTVTGSSGGSFEVTSSSGALNVGNVTAGANVALLGGHAGINVIDGDAIQSTNNGNITLQGDSISFAGTISAGTGTVTLQPHGAVAISVGDNVGNLTPFDITSQDLANITAGTLVIGRTDVGGGLTLTGAINVAGSNTNGVYNLVFLNGGNYQGTGQSISLGSHNLTVDVGGSLDSGALTGNQSSTVLLSSFGTGSITQQANTTITAGTLSLTAQNGEIGTALVPIETAATYITANSYHGDVYLNSSGNGPVIVGIGGVASSASGTWQLVTGGNITNVASIASAGQIDLTAQVNLINTGTITSTGTTNLNAPGIFTNSGVITSGGSLNVTSGSFVNTGHIAATNLMAITAQLISNSGSIMGASTIDLSAATSLTNVGAISATGVITATIASGNLNNMGTISGGPSSTIIASGSISNNGEILTNSGDLSMSAGNITNNNQIEAAGALTIVTISELTNPGTITAGNTSVITLGTTLNNSGAISVSNGDLNINCQSMVNSGTVASTNGSITLTFNSPSCVDCILLTNVGGAITAQQGSINLNVNTQNITSNPYAGFPTFDDGSFMANSINVNIANGDSFYWFANQITGTINSLSNCASCYTNIESRNGSLTVGNLSPNTYIQFWADNGNIVITSNINLTGPSSELFLNTNGGSISALPAVTTISCANSINITTGGGPGWGDQSASSQPSGPINLLQVSLTATGIWVGGSSVSVQSFNFISSNNGDYIYSSGDINMGSPIAIVNSGPGNAGVTINAGGNITVPGAVTITYTNGGTGSLNITSGSGSISIDGSVSIVGGQGSPITLSAGSNITVNGSVSNPSGSISLVGQGNISVASTIVGGGSISVAGQGNISVAGAIASNGINGSNVQITAGGSSNPNSTVSIGGDINTSATLYYSGSVNITATSSISLGGNVITQAGTGSYQYCPTCSLNYYSGGNVNIQSANSTVSITGYVNTASLGSALPGYAGATTINAQGAVKIGGPIEGAASITTQGSVDVEGSISGAATVTAQGYVNIVGSILGATTISSQSYVNIVGSISGATAITSQSYVDIGGPITVTTTDALGGGVVITAQGNVSVGGPISITNSDCGGTLASQISIASGGNVSIGGSVSTIYQNWGSFQPQSLYEYDSYNSANSSTTITSQGSILVNGSISVQGWNTSLVQGTYYNGNPISAFGSSITLTSPGNLTVTGSVYSTGDAGSTVQITAGGSFNPNSVVNIGGDINTSATLYAGGSVFVTATSKISIGGSLGGSVITTAGNGSYQTNSCCPNQVQTHYYSGGSVNIQSENSSVTLTGSINTTSLGSSLSSYNGNVSISPIEAVVINGQVYTGPTINVFNIGQPEYDYSIIDTGDCDLTLDTNEICVH